MAPRRRPLKTTPLQQRQKKRGKPGNIIVKREEYKFSAGPNPMAGICITPAAAGEKVQIVYKGFFTDRQTDLVTVLEGLRNPFLAPYLSDETNHVSNIDNFVIQLNSKEIWVRINMLSEGLATAFVRQAVKKGDLVTQVAMDTFASVKFPHDYFDLRSGIIIFFQVGWHRILYIDLSPLRDSNTTLHDLSAQLAIAVNEAIFPLPTQEELDLLFQYRWFPFNCLTHGEWAFNIGRLQAGVEWKTIENEILALITPQKLGNMISRWKKHAAFRQILPMADVAKKAYLSENFPSCISVLWPKIEGLMISLFKSKKQYELLPQFEQQVLYPLKHLSGFLPTAFKQYLERRYFMEFNPEDEESELSRHSLSHGIASMKDMENKAYALTGFLILEQMYQLLNALEQKP